MTRYFFNIKDADMPDLKGVDLPGLDEAHRVASVMANALTRNEGGTKKITIVVTDDYDNPAFEVTVSARSP